MQDEQDSAGANEKSIMDDHCSRADIEAFIEHARACCDVIERISEGKEHEHYRQLFTCLCLLTSAAIQLPRLTSTSDHEYESLLMSSDEWTALADRLQEQIRSDCRAISEIHPKIFREQYEMLFDDLADLYKDLRDGLRVWALDTSEAREEALWHWSFSFEHHTARHLFRALATLYEIMYHFALFDS